MNNDKPKRLLTRDQAELVAEISATYGTEPEDIVFFTADLKPLLGYETQCVMLNRLQKPIHVNIEPVEPVSPDSVSYLVSLAWPDGTGASAVGVANVNESIDGERQSDQQIVWLASSRALRSALRIRGIDLLKLHWQQKDAPMQFTGVGKSNRANLLAQAHKLGQEAYLIVGDDKSLWYKTIGDRYSVNNSGELSDERLGDFVAFLSARVATIARAASA